MKASEITVTCTGCKCCEAVCPKGAISFKSDCEGFAIPCIDENKCVDCHLCQKRCPQNLDLFHVDFQQIALGLTTREEELLKKSASGGVFSTLALSVIQNGGVVVGCAYDEQLVARHVIVDNENELPKLLSSKYVQSDTGGIFVKVKELLESGKFVFFSGTGCQIAALKSYLHRAYDNLITADIICHGVPSPLLFKKYIEWLSKKYDSKVTYINYRSKKPKGWGQTLQIDTETGKTTGKNTKKHYVFGRCDPFYKAYLAGKLHRYACYKCRYNGTYRASDFTMGDFWNILKTYPHFYNYWGVSEVIVNTQQGYDFLKKHISHFSILHTDIATLEAGNANLIRPENMPVCRPRLKALMSLPGEQLFETDYFAIPKIQYIKDKIIFCVPVGIKTFIKKIFRKFIN